MRLHKRGAFWASASVLALALWSSGAPSVLYPSYEDLWDLNPAIITFVFATYQLVLIAVLLVFGNLSDRLGRRIVMMWGVGLITGSAVVFALAPNVGFLFAGRVLQGAGAGLAMGAATASLVENSPSRNPRFASTLATISTASGLTLALVISGVLARFAPLPLFWSYIVLLVLGLGTFMALACSPTDRPTDAPRLRFATLRLAPGLRLTFTIATLSVALAYGVGAIFLSLGAHMIRQFVQTEDTLVIGVLLGCSSAAIGATALLLRSVPAFVSVWTGTVLTAISLAIMLGAAWSGSVVVFLVWCLIGGAAYSLTFTGGLGLINRSAPEQHRGSTLSLLYLYAYLLQAATAIGIGVLATASGLDTAVIVATIALSIVCLAVIVLCIIWAHTTRLRSDSTPTLTSLPASHLPGSTKSDQTIERTHL